MNQLFQVGPLCIVCLCTIWGICLQPVHICHVGSSVCYGHHHVCRRVTCAELHANVSSYLRRLMHRGVSSVTASSISSVESCRWPGAKSRVRPHEGLLGQNQISVYLSTLWNMEWAKLYVGFVKPGGLSFPNSWRKLVKWYTCDENKCGSGLQDDVPSILSLISWAQLLI